jgi:tetratricopeptide (TPR) repeat protein
MTSPAADIAATQQQLNAIPTAGRGLVRFELLAVEAFRQVGDVANPSHTLGYLAWIAIDHRAHFEVGERLLRESLALHLDQGDDHLASERLGWLALLAIRRGDEASARHLVDEALSYNCRHPDDHCPAVLDAAGQVALLGGEHEVAQTLFEELLVHTETTGQKPFVADVLGRLGEVARLRGDLPEAARRFGEQLQSATALNDLPAIEYALNGLAMVALHRAETSSARSSLDQAARIARARGRAVLPDDLRSAAAVLAAEGRAQEAAQVLAAAEVRAEVLGCPTVPAYRAEHEALRSHLRTALGNAAFRNASEAGRGWSVADALRAAFGPSLVGRVTRTRS